MNLTVEAATALARSLRQRLALSGMGRKVEVALCPSFEALVSVKKALGRSRLSLGAQDVFWQAYGPFTGEVAAHNLRAIGCRYVIVGHSERRQHLGETNDMINRKVKAALEAGLIPVLCVGETIEERREQQQAADYCLRAGMGDRYRSGDRSTGSRQDEPGSATGFD